jgi:hypothetical protein
LAEALAMMTIKAFSFLLNGPCESSFRFGRIDMGDLVYGIQKTEEATARNDGLHKDT